MLLSQAALSVVQQDKCTLYSKIRPSETSLPSFRFGTRQQGAQAFLPCLGERRIMGPALLPSIRPVSSERGPLGLQG